MTATEMIVNAEKFSALFTETLQDESATLQSKQVYFMDNQDELRKYMGALQKAIEVLKQTEGNNDSESEGLLARAETIVSNLKKVIGKFQQELTISSDVSETDIAPILNEETINDAVRNNKAVQGIVASMEAISQQKEANVTTYNYMLMCDSDTTMIYAQDKQSLEAHINKVVNDGNYQSIKLYKLTCTPVPLTTKTVLSVL